MLVVPAMSSLTLKQKSNLDGFPKAVELIEITGAHQLEACDRAIQNMLFQHAHDSGRMTDAGAKWELKFSELREPVSKHESTDRVRESLKRLMNVKVTVHYRAEGSGEERTMTAHLLEFIDTSDKGTVGATVRYGIPEELRVVLIRSNRWGRVKCEITYAMSSKYAITLYELICMRANKESCVEAFPLGRFRELMSVPSGTYERDYDFRRFVIEPALLEVNGLSSLHVEIELRRKHSRAPVHEVAIAWRRKEGDEFRAALEERQRHKAGRKARLRGMVEKAEV